jgi:tight adherence protein B
MVQILTLVVFLLVLVLAFTGIYLLVEVPAAKKRLRARLATVQELAAGSEQNPETAILRTEVLSGIPWLNRLFMKWEFLNGVNLWVQQSAIEVSLGMLLTLSFLIFWMLFLALLLANLPILMALIIGLAGSTSPFLFVAVKRQRRFFKFEEQFPEAIDLLARAVRAGHAFTTGLDLIAKEMPAPVSDEFRRTYEQQNLGLPLRDALQNMTRRMPVADVRIFVTALLIQRESGGNLAEILDNLSYVIRERFKLFRQIKVLTAQARFTLYILLAMPPLTALMLYTMDKEYLMRLFTDPLGHQMLIGAVVLQIMGYFVIRKIIEPKF